MYTRLMRQAAALALVLASASWVSAGCGSATPEPVIHEAIGSGTEAGVEVRASEGTTALSLACDENVAERCDGVDQNCDGRIDEGCGYQNQGIDLTLAWNTGVAVALTVEGTDAAIDHAGRGDCASEQAHNRIYSLAPEGLEPGSYRVLATQVEDCGVELADGEHTTVAVTGSTAGGSFGPLTQELGAEPVELLTITVTE